MERFALSPLAPGYPTLPVYFPTIQKKMQIMGYCYLMTVSSIEIIIKGISWVALIMSLKS